MTCAVLIWLTS